MTTHDQLAKIIISYFNDDDIVLAEDTKPADVAGWDSLAHVSLMFVIEEAFGVTFDGDELSRFITIGDLERLIERKAGRAVTNADPDAHRP